ncbi:hypothetical protein C1704_09515 [Caldimonas caldifontis]|uniref:Uncharacterized protein n=1 Tax=Caldimonas caldifontis TaxID=1452508 RepID=A0A2S5SUW9_9BURK|nr:hypothetical protein C1704_09515 [Caldimonas caldifontis]
MGSATCIARQVGVSPCANGDRRLFSARLCENSCPRGRSRLSQPAQGASGDSDPAEPEAGNGLRELEGHGGGFTRRQQRVARCDADLRRDQVGWCGRIARHGTDRISSQRIKALRGECRQSCGRRSRLARTNFLHDPFHAQTRRHAVTACVGCEAGSGAILPPRGARLQRGDDPIDVFRRHDGGRLDVVCGHQRRSRQGLSLPWHIGGPRFILNFELGAIGQHHHVTFPDDVSETQGSHLSVRFSNERLADQCGNSADDRGGGAGHVESLRVHWATEPMAPA